MYFEASKIFIYKNARPLDLARWQYLFENGDKDFVLNILTEYQNEDGGFGHALEPDCWNPETSPIQTWVATQIIKEVALKDKSHPIIQGILRYLSSGKNFDGHTWSNSIPTNNDHPHAPWWNYSPSGDVSYNPTACFVGFILKFADKNSDLYNTACRLAKESYYYFKANFPMESMHTVSCFVELYEYLKEVEGSDILDMDEFSRLLHEQIHQVITYDTSRWSVDYICKPSIFIHSLQSEFYEENKDICSYECDFILSTQKKDGTWNITWSWSKYPKEWSISKNWWKSDLIINNIKYLKAMQNQSLSVD